MSRNNLANFRYFKKCFWKSKDDDEDPTISEIASDDVISEEKYDHMPAPILGLGLNFIHFGIFVPGSINVNYCVITLILTKYGNLSFLLENFA